MTGLTLVVLLAVAAVVVPVAGVVSSVETALAQLSVARVQSLIKDERPGAARLQRVCDDLDARIVELKEKEDLAAVRPELDGNEIMEILGSVNTTVPTASRR